jgi:hypothetical protein
LSWLSEEAAVDRRVVLQTGALVWAVVGAAIALPALATIDDGALLLVGAASILGPVAAVLASWLIGRHRGREAGALLLASVFTPTYFFVVLNLPALVLGIALLAVPGKVLPDEHAVAPAS